MPYPSNDISQSIANQPKLAIDLMLNQWDELSAPKLRKLLRNITDIIQQQLINPIQYIESSISLRSNRNPVGVWLDFIGHRLGIYREYRETTDKLFGFSDEDVSFDLGPFADNSDINNPKTPLGDIDYKSILEARGLQIRSFPDKKDFNIFTSKLNLEALSTGQYRWQSRTDVNGISYAILTYKISDSTKVALFKKQGIFPNILGIRTVEVKV